MTEVVLETPLTDDQRECLETAKSAADSLLGLVNDLLNFEKIEAGKLELDLADFSLRPAVDDALRPLTVTARAKGLKLFCKVAPDVPEALIGDAGRLRQVLTNLIGNAVKFTKEGEVAVQVEIVDDRPDEKGAVLRFAVSDTGIGIPPDGQERIFRAFEQVDSSTTRHYGGTGLGLTIAARLVALMGGTITVDSKPGQGSTFAFTTRFRRQPHPAQAGVARPSVVPPDGIAPSPIAAPLHVLVAEDSEFNSRHLERLLLRLGHQIRLAKDGRETLALLGIGGDGAETVVAQTPGFDVLLLDIHMPELDGFAVVKAIRERERVTGAHLPVIALTARSRQEDREDCLSAGMDDYLSKPIQAAQLFAAIERQLQAARGIPPLEPPQRGDDTTLPDPVS